MADSKSGDGLRIVTNGIPFAVVAFVLVQFAGIVWWGATTDAEINSLKEKIELVKDSRDAIPKINERLATIEATLVSIEWRMRSMNNGGVYREPRDNR